MAQSQHANLASEDTEEACSLMLQKLTVAELKHVLKQFGYRVGGKKSVLQSRVNGLLRLQGSSQVGAVIQQIPGVSHRIGSICNTDVNGSSHTRPHCNSCHVKFKEATFFTSISRLVEPTLLLRSKKSYMNCESIKISLTDMQLTNLKLSQAIDEDDDDDKPKVFVLLRFCRNDPDEPQEDCCPTSCDIGVKLHFDWYPITLSKKVMNCPVDITKLVTAQSSPQVTLLIRWLDRMDAREYVYSIDIMKRCVIEDIVKTIRIISAANVKAKIKAKLSSFTSNEEVSSSSQQISFQCPLSMSRLKYPCRGANCKHLQCFDATSYLRLNRVKASWICPVCQQTVTFSELEIDGLQLEVLHQSSVVKIEFDADGCWHPLSNNDKIRRVLSLDDDDRIDVRPKKKACGEKIDLIDLTIDSPLKANHAPTTIVL